MTCPQAEKHTRKAGQFSTENPGQVSAKINTEEAKLRTAQRLAVSPSLVHVWVQHGILEYDQRQSASRVWVRLNEGDLARLTGGSAITPEMPTFAEVMRTENLSRDALWERVRAGQYHAFRVSHGQCWEWRLQRSASSAVGSSEEAPNHHE